MYKHRYIINTNYITEKLVRAHNCIAIFISDINQYIHRYFYKTQKMYSSYEIMTHLIKHWQVSEWLKIQRNQMEIIVFHLIISFLFVLYLCNFFSVLDIEPRATHLLCQHATT
jgi:hypothetical protein